MHVWRRATDLPQSWRFEVALPRSIVGKFAVAPGYAGVVKALIGEVWTGVTHTANGLAAEKREAGFLGGCKRRWLSGRVPVESRIAGADRADVTGECRRDFGNRQFRAPLQIREQSETVIWD